MSATEEGGVFLITPKTEAAESWFREHLPKDALKLGPATVIEHRYADMIIEGMVRGAGLDVEKDGRRRVIWDEGSETLALSPH